MVYFLNVILEKQITVHARQIASKLLDPKRPRLATIGSAARSGGRSENLGVQLVIQGLSIEPALFLIWPKSRARGAKGGQRRPPVPLVSPALLLSGQKKLSRPTFLRHLTYMDIKVAASGLSDHQTWSRNLFEFVFAIQLESFLYTFNSQPLQ